MVYHCLRNWTHLSSSNKGLVLQEQKEAALSWSPCGPSGPFLYRRVPSRHEDKHWNKSNRETQLPRHADLWAAFSQFNLVQFWYSGLETCALLVTLKDCVLVLSFIHWIYTFKLMHLKEIVSKAHSYCSSHSLYFIKPLQNTASRWGTHKHYYSQYLYRAAPNTSKKHWLQIPDRPGYRQDRNF